MIKYEGKLLSDILQDKGASVADAECAAYDGKVVTSKKLSLRLLVCTPTHHDPYEATH